MPIPKAIYSVAKFNCSNRESARTTTSVSISQSEYFVGRVGHVI